MELNEINPSDIPDISELKIDRRKKERILDLLTKVENPYVFKVMDIQFKQDLQIMANQHNIV